MRSPPGAACDRVRPHTPNVEGAGLRNLTDVGAQRLWDSFHRMETFTTIVGHQSADEFRESVRTHVEAGSAVCLRIPAKELGRRRLKVQDQHGKEYGIALPRNADLGDGTVLAIDQHRVVLVEAEESKELVLQAVSPEAGIRLGWVAGHLHWKVRFEGDRLAVLLEAPRSEYVKRLGESVGGGSIRIVDVDVDRT